MSPALRPLAALVLLACAAAGPPRAQTVTAAATVSPSRVAVGGRVAYTLSLRGMAGRALAAPPVSGGLRLVQPRPTSDVMTQINGRVEREVTWTFEAVRPGPARIGPVRVPVGAGQVLTVAASTVQVRPASAAPSAPQGALPGPAEQSDLFARVELRREAAVVGQQVVAEVVLYFSPRLQPHQTMVAGAWDAPGFWREELDVVETVPHPVTLGGRAYEAVTLRRLALFPTRAGRLTLPPMRFTVDLLRVDPFDPFAPFFSPVSSGFEEREVEAPAVALDVSPLPAGAPAGFGGAVGRFTLTAAPVQTAVAAGDPVQVRLTISGTGNVATLDAPALRPPVGVDAFRPRSEADVDRTGRE
ncbi:MAG TPA: BatD family protein, partial [Rubricoccaceae bacterium]